MGSIVQFIAADPDGLLPPAAQVKAALEILSRRFPIATDISVTEHDTVVLIDCGEDLMTVRCPSCGADLLEDRRWQQMMDSAWEAGMRHRSFDLPCCGVNHALEDLAYDWPMGFGRFSLDVWDPDVTWFLPDGRGDATQARAILKELGTTLGVEMQAIWRHL
jgi:hypothetical protein